jgi:hypothetical protein
MPNCAQTKVAYKKLWGAWQVTVMLRVARTLIAARAHPTQLFQDTYESEGRPDQTCLMRAAASGVREMLDDALSREHDIYAVDSKGRSALAHVPWSALAWRTSSHLVTVCWPREPAKGVDQDSCRWLRLPAMERGAGQAWC